MFEFDLDFIIDNHKGKIDHDMDLCADVIAWGPGTATLQLANPVIGIRKDGNLACTKWNVDHRRVPKLEFTISEIACLKVCDDRALDRLWRFELTVSEGFSTSFRLVESCDKSDARETCVHNWNVDHGVYDSDLDVFAA
jgi:hypothetical protein